MQNTLVSFLFLCQQDFPSSTFVQLHPMLAGVYPRVDPWYEKRDTLTDNMVVLLCFLS